MVRSYHNTRGMCTFTKGGRRESKTKWLIATNGGNIITTLIMSGHILLKVSNSRTQCMSAAHCTCTHGHTHACVHTHTMALVVEPKRCSPRVKSPAPVVKVLACGVPCISLSATVTTCTNNLGCLIQTSWHCSWETCDRFVCQWTLRCSLLANYNRRVSQKCSHACKIVDMEVPGTL